MGVRLGALLLAATALSLVAAAGTQATTRVGSAVAPAGLKPAWAPNGRQIAFADLGGPLSARSWRLFVIGADGSGRRQVVDLGRDAPQGISWSPDGSRIAYDAFATADQVTSVFTVAAAGGQATEVTSGWAPSWGPGNRLLIVDRSPEFSDTRLFTVNANGTGKEEFQPCPEAEIGGCFDGHPEWSADGNRIAFDTIRGNASAVWTVAPDGSSLRMITPFFPAGAHPRWTANGAQIVYSQFSDPNSSVGDVAIMNADGSGSRVVIKDGEFPDPSPDGATIVFARSGALHLVNTDGSNLRRLTAPAVTPPPPVVRCVVPKLAGKTLKAARAALKKANCKAGKVTRARSRKVKVGRVILSRPKAGTRRPIGSAVALVVSRGRR